MKKIGFVRRLVPAAILMIWPLAAFPATLNCHFDAAGRQICEDAHASLRTSDSSYRAPQVRPQGKTDPGRTSRKAVLLTTRRVCYDNARGERECRLLPR